MKYTDHEFIEATWAGPQDPVLGPKAVVIAWSNRELGFGEVTLWIEDSEENARPPICVDDENIGMEGVLNVLRALVDTVEKFGVIKR